MLPNLYLVIQKDKLKKNTSSSFHELQYESPGVEHDSLKPEHDSLSPSVTVAIFCSPYNQLTTFKGVNKAQYNEQQQEQQAWVHNT
jgi:hypothetical protein